LLEAARSGDLVLLRARVEAGADLNAPAAGGRTPLIEAAVHGQLEAARVLIEGGAELNANQRGWGTPLDAAERAGHVELAAMLRQEGARSASGRSVGDTVCVRPWAGEGYCGTVEATSKASYRIHVTEIVGCRDGCPAKADCSAGRAVGGARGVQTGDELTTVSWCLTDTGVLR
jgi:hypothetical protein